MILTRPTALAALGSAAFMACGGDGGGMTEPPGPPTQVAKTSGDGQSWYFGNPLPNPYTVTVKDVNNRNVPNVTVTWTVAAGGGSVSSATSQTDANGVASTTHTLGPAATSQSVLATVSGLAPVGFTATATAPGTAVSISVQDNRFVPADTAVKVGGSVTWTWAGAGVEPHNVVFNQSSPTPRPPDSGAPKTTGTYSGTFATPGRYPYFCVVHAGMNGTLHVVN